MNRVSSIAINQNHKDAYFSGSTPLCSIIFLSNSTGLSLRIEKSDVYTEESENKVAMCKMQT